MKGDEMEHQWGDEDAYKASVRTPEEKRPLGTRKCR